MSRPRREAWSFLWVLKCSVSSPIRSLRIAIWTSGEPVSVSWVRKRSIRVVFLAVASTACVTPLVFSGPLSSVYCETNMNARCGAICPAGVNPNANPVGSARTKTEEPVVETLADHFGDFNLLCVRMVGIHQIIPGARHNRGRHLG